jgi:hypothetical protein
VAVRLSVAIAPTPTPTERQVAFDAALKHLFQEGGLTPAVGFRALKSLQWLRTRLQLRSSPDAALLLDDVQYKHEVGDLVVHSVQGHLGVIAARFALNLMPDAWVDQNLSAHEPKVRDALLQVPWYSILVDVRSLPQTPNFVRFGSELTHKAYRGPPLEAIQHGLLPHLFSHFDPVALRYVPRYSENDIELLRWLLRRDLLIPHGRLQALLGPPTPDSSVPR